MLRPLRFALDAASECVLFEGGVKLRGQSARLVGELLPRFLEGARAGRGPDGYKIVGSRPLSRSLEVTEEALRRRIARLREDLAGRVRSATPPRCWRNDFIENRPWAGYRLNPFLIVDVSLLRAAAAASGHVTHPDSRRHTFRLSAAYCSPEWPPASHLLEPCPQIWSCAAARIPRESRG